jgi:hypothetical protein
MPAATTSNACRYRAGRVSTALASDDRFPSAAYWPATGPSDLRPAQFLSP